METSKYNCECGKFFEKAQSLNAHYSHCLVHRKGVKETRKHVVEKRMSGWDKFSKEDISAIATKAAKRPRKPMTDEAKKNLSEKLKGKTGGYREGTNKWKGGRVFSLSAGKEVWLDSRWEIEFIDILNFHNIKWKKNYSSFEYEWESKKKRYIPDFYLEELNMWIEVKGWEREIDHVKWKDFPEHLKIIRRIDLDKLKKIENKEAIVAELVYAQG